MTRSLLACSILALLSAPLVAGTPLVGQVTCSVCWTEADRSRVPYGGEADRACARRCADDGVPPAIARRDDEGNFGLVALEGDPPKPHGSWLELIGNFVRAETEPAEGGAPGSVRVTDLAVLEASPWPEPDSSAPLTSDLSWTDLTGAEQSLDAHRGRIAVINFWATWCKPCVEEMPVLASIQSDYGPLGVQVVGIAADAPGAARAVLDFARKAGVTFPVWLGASTGDMAALGVGPSLPATVVLDREGRVVYRVAGVVDGADLREHLDALVAPPAGALDARLAGEPPRQASLVPS